MLSLLQKKGVTKKDVQKFIKKTGKETLSAKDESGQTAIHICASEGKTEILEYLLRKHKDYFNLDLKDNHGWTPLVCAAHSAQLAAIELLLMHNADPNIKTNDDATCLHYFAKIKASSKDKNYYISLTKQLLKKISNLDAQNKVGETPLHKAARDGVVDFVRILVESGANVNLTDINGYTPLHVAAALGDADIVSALLRGKPDVTLRSNDGTAREIAKSKNFTKIVQLIDDFEKSSQLQISTATIQKTVTSSTITPTSPKSPSVPSSPSSPLSETKTVPFSEIQNTLSPSMLSRSRMSSTTEVKSDSTTVSINAKMFTSQRFVANFEHDLASPQKYARGEQIIEQEFQELERRTRLKESWQDREERLRKDQIRRYNIMREIVESERAYVAFISIAVKNVREPLRSGPDPILTEMEGRDIFSLIPNIVLFNQAILDELETRFKGWNPTQGQTQIVGDIFERMSRFLKTYTQYISKFDSGVREAKRLMKKNKRFAEWLEEAKKKNGIDLFRLLIAPIQRIPVYVFLVEDLLRYTPTEHPDHEKLKTMLHSVREVARHLETMRAESENRTRVLKIKNNLIGYNEELATSERLFIKEGFAQIVIKGKAVPHHLFLFNDLLLWAKVSKGKSGDVYSYVGSVPISDISSCRNSAADIGKYSFSLTIKNKQQIFLAESEDDRRTWIRAIVDLAVKTRDHIWKKIETTGPAPSKRSSHSSVVVGRRLFLFGGQRNSNWFNDMYILDLDKYEWTKVPDSENAPTPRSEHAATAVDDKIWIFGGFDGSNRLNDLYTFDTNTLKWTKINIVGKDVPIGRSGHKMVRYGTSTVYIFGGIDDQGNYSNELYVFDANQNPVEMKWIKTTGEVPDVRAFHSMDVINGLIWIYGGYAFKNYYNDTKVLDPKHYQWAGIRSDLETPAGRYNHATIPLDSNIILLYGGFSGGDVNTDLWALDTDTKLWIQLDVPLQLEPRHRHTANIYTLPTGHKEVIVIGGESFDGYCDSVLVFQGLDKLKEDRKYQANIERGVRVRKERGVSLAPLLQDHPAVVSEIGTPYNAQRKTLIDENFQWVAIDPVRDFEIKGVLGEGAFGVVFEAEFKALHTLVAIKEIKDFKGDRMRREIENLRKLKHQNIVPFFGTLEKEKNLWILMECQLGSLKHLMRDCTKTLNEQQIAIVAKCILAGLQHLHHNNIIHRDIKSANILFNEQAEIKLADFGIAQQLSEEFPSLKGTAGSLQWMAPEIVNRQPSSFKADIWSFGMMILELLEGQVPKYNALAHTLTPQPPPWQASPSLMSTFNSTMISTINKDSKPVNQYIEGLKASPQLIEFVSLCLRVNPDLRPSAVDLLKHPFVQAVANVNQYEAFKDLIQIFLKNKKRRDHDFRSLSLKYTKKPSPSAKSRDTVDTHSTLIAEWDTLKQTILQQLTFSNNDTVQEVQKQLAIARAETEITRVELKQTREELEQQKLKVHDMELNQKKKISEEMDKFKKELLDDIMGNIKKYVAVLAKENELAQISTDEKQQQMTNLVAENIKLNAELKVLKERNKTLSDEIEHLKERLANKSRPGTDEEDDEIASHGRSLSKKSIGSEGSSNSDSGVTVPIGAASPPSSTVSPLSGPSSPLSKLASKPENNLTQANKMSSEAFVQKLTIFERPTVSSNNSISEKENNGRRQLKKSPSIDS
jgi:serine/threonine protein kinase/ankyrin repeat protein